MVNQQLFDYIKRELQQNITKEQIKESLMANGWQLSDIEEAFNLLNQPAAENTASQPLSTLSAQPPKKLNKKISLAILLTAGVLIVGGVIFAYFNYSQSPEKIVQKMIGKLSEIKFLEYSGKIKIEINTNSLSNNSKIFLQPTKSAQNTKTSSFLIDFTGKFDIQKLNSPKTSFSVNTSQDNFDVGLEVRIIDKNIYFKLNNISNLVFLDLSAINNKWIKADTEILKDQIIPAYSGKQFKKEVKKQSLSSKQIKKIIDIVKEAKIINIVKKLPNEKVGDVNAYHYKFTINRNAIKKLFIDTNQIIKNKIPTEKEIVEFNKKIENMEFSDGEIWIGKKDFLLYKIYLNLINKKISNLITSKNVYNITLLFKNFNKPVKINTPAYAESFEKILGSLLNSIVPTNTLLPPGNQQISNMSKRAKDAKIIKLIKQALSLSEMLYDVNSANPYSSIKITQPDIAKIAKDISNQGGKLTVSVSTYGVAFSSPLATGEIYCEDNSGNVGSLTGTNGVCP